MLNSVQKLSSSCRTITRRKFRRHDNGQTSRQFVSLVRQLAYFLMITKGSVGADVLSIHNAQKYQKSTMYMTIGTQIVDSKVALIAFSKNSSKMYAISPSILHFFGFKLAHFLMITKGSALMSYPVPLTVLKNIKKVHDYLVKWN